LENEIKIDKIGHRLRILNRLNSEAKLYSEKLKQSTKTKKVETIETKKEDVSMCNIF